MNDINYKRLVFILNPKAGIKKKEGFLVDVINEFEDHNYITEIHYTRAQGDGTRLVLEHGRNADMIVCMGGDGTLNEVIEGIVQGGIASPIGYIPAGSTNDFASSLNLSTQPETAAMDIMTRTPKPIDIGRFNNRYFVYTASCGIFTRTSYETPQNFKNIFGHFAYVLEGIKDLGNVKQLKLNIKYDDKEINGNYIFAAICNSTSIGGIMTINKEKVDFADGLFELLLIKFPKDLIELGIIITKLQNQVYDNSIQLIPVSKLQISNCANIDWSLDGEKEEGQEVVDFEVFHRAVNLIY